MNVFQTHSRIVEDYKTYICSFLNIADSKIRERVEEELGRGKLWPEPLLQFNPSFEIVGSVAELPRPIRFIGIRLKRSRSGTMPGKIYRI